MTEATEHARTKATGLPRWLSGKGSACTVTDPGSIPGWGRSPGEGDGDPLQCSCLENSIDREAWQVIEHAVAKSRSPMWEASVPLGLFLRPSHQLGSPDTTMQLVVTPLAPNSE